VAALRRGERYQKKNKRMAQAPASTSTRGHGCFPIEPQRVTPKILQAVKGAFVSVKHVHDYLQVIKHNPLAGWKSVNCRWSNRVILF